jgi:hypothetical protein
MVANPVVPREEIRELELASFPKPTEEVIFKQRLKKLLYEIFSGHEDYLGVTLDGSALWLTGTKANLSRAQSGRHGGSQSHPAPVPIEGKA